jgi:LPS sulfotransferase NodH
VSALREHPFRKLYRTAFDFPIYPTEPKKSYFLSAIPRTGSTWFSLQLWRTGVLGAPLEYLNLHDRGDDIQRFGGGDMHSYWRSVRQRRTSPNGVFGSKLFTGTIRDVFNRQRSALALITSDFLIDLRRRDKIEQAVSYARAMQTRVWIEGGYPPFAEPKYNSALLRQCLESIQRQEASWRDIAERTGARVLTLYYEDYCDDPKTAIRRVMEFLGVGPAARPLRHIPDIPKQRDAISAEWVRRFTADLAKDHQPRSDSIQKEKDDATTKA